MVEDCPSLRFVANESLFDLIEEALDRTNFRPLCRDIFIIFADTGSVAITYQPTAAEDCKRVLLSG